MLLLTCKAVWAPGSKILQSTSSCCCWNSSSQFTTCTMLQQLLWPLACSRAQQGAQSYCLAEGKETWEARGRHGVTHWALQNSFLQLSQGLQRPLCH